MQGSDSKSEACERQVGHLMQTPKPPEKEDLACSPGSWTPPNQPVLVQGQHSGCQLSWLATLLMAMLNPVSSPDTTQ